MKLVKVEKIEDDYAKACFQVMNEIKNQMRIVRNLDGKIAEQNFMISFAYMLGSILGQTGFLHGGEIEKILACPNKEVQKLRLRIRASCKKKKQTNVTVKPDFIIHSSINRVNLNENNQKLVIEAKTSNYLGQDQFSWDLYKLGAYINQLGYKVGIYIIVNECEKRIEKLIEGYLLQKLPIINIPVNRSLFFFFQKDDNSEPEVYKLV